MAHLKRVVVLVDMDCFYCQVEEKLDPRLEGKPLAVVQYNAWRGGGIIAVNYPARDRGVTRHMRGNEAKEKCPEIELVRVPEVRGKADLTKYREAGKRVAEVLQTFTPLLERASVDEAYLDITQSVENRIQDDFEISVDLLKNTFTIGQDIKDFIANVKLNKEFCESNYKLAMGAVIVEELREAVYNQTGYRCSAGIAHNKILSKLACGLHKPNKQTILTHDAIHQLYETLPVKRIKSLGGKFGEILSEKLKITTMSELSQFSEKELLKQFDEKTGSWLYNIARGIDLEPVNVRLISKSIGCCKKFPGRTALTSQSDVDHWLNELATEMAERLEKDLEENNRKAKQMVVSFAQELKRADVSSSRSLPLNSYEQQKIFQSATDVIKKQCQKSDGSYCVKFLGISVGNFEDIKKVREITSFFKNMSTCQEQSRKRCHSPEINREDIDISVKTGCDILPDPNNESFKNTNMGNDDKDENESDSSIYSKSTLEEDIDRENLIYYDEIYPDSVRDQSFLDFQNEKEIIENISTNSRDSISQEIIEGTRTRDINIFNNNMGRPASSSFFAKYFESNRNFDTSKVLIDSDDENASSEIDENKSSDTSDKATYLNLANVQHKNMSSPRSETVVENDTSQLYKLCSECSKKVSFFEYQSHMDYHFALNLVRNEAHLYNSDNSNSNNSKAPSDNSFKKADGKKPTNTSNKNSKSKPRSSANNTKPLLNFLSKVNVDIDERTSTNSEVCLECKKLIKLEEMASHLDFHAAKKLHLEINKNNDHNKLSLDEKCGGPSTSNELKGNPKNKNRKSKKSNSNKVTKPNSITNFLKPL